MTLPVSNNISFNAINLELNRTATAQLSINDSELRSLFGQANGSVDLSSGLGKSSRMTITPDSWYWYGQPSDNDFYPSYGYVDPLVSALPWWQLQTGGYSGQTPAGGRGSITTQSIPNTTYKLRAMWDRDTGGTYDYPLYIMVSDLSEPPDVYWVNVDTYGYPYGSGTDLPAYELGSGYLGGAVGYWKAYGLSSPNYGGGIVLGNPKGVNSINAASHRLVTSGQYGDAWGTYIDGPSGFWFYSNGTSTIGNWSSPTTAGIGSQYEISFENKGQWSLQDSNNQPLAFATWLPLTNGVQIYALYGGWGQTGVYQIRKAGASYPFVTGVIQLGV
jgi:hypothetical protein